MAATHKITRNKSSKRKFRKVTKKGTQNKRRRRTLKIHGGTTNSPEKDDLLMKLMPNKPMNSLRRAFSKTDVNTLKNMTHEECEAIYNNWRNAEAEIRKRLRLIKRANTSTTNEMPNVFYDNNGLFDPSNPRDPLNDLQDYDNWQNDVPKKRVRQRHAANMKPIKVARSFPDNDIFDNNGNVDTMNDFENNENMMHYYDNDLDIEGIDPDENEHM